MSFPKRTLFVLVLLSSMALLAAPAFAQKPKPSSKPATAPAKSLMATGQHRGYTNDELFLRLDDGKEMTFLVQIPGDKDGKWHDQFKTLSRITVTYHEEPGKKHLIATAIEQAKDPVKK